MFGPVSISSNFPTVTKDIMTFYYSHYYGQDGLVEPRLPYSYSNKLSDIKELFGLKDKNKILNFKINFSKYWSINSNFI